ncbi:MAG: NADH-quinone oxidoreductase subunit J [Chloroflexi bacterium]|nr:NADH-quinone oxidoreductase subunit J [Chloroflexota bacterium]
MEAFFWVVAIPATVSAVGVVMMRDTVYSALLLVVHLLAVAVLFVLLNAQLIAAVQVVVYAGAIMVLFLFVIMMLGLGRGEGVKEKLPLQRPVALLFGGAMAILLGVVMSQTTIQPVAGALTPGDVLAMGGNTQVVGRLLFSDYLLAFEVTSILLLVAIIGAVVLAKRRL